MTAALALTGGGGSPHTFSAFLSRPAQNFCPEARQILEQVKSAYSDDPILMSIVADSEGICERLDTGAAGAATENPPTAPEMIESTPTPGG